MASQWSRGFKDTRAFPTFYYPALSYHEASPPGQTGEPWAQGLAAHTQDLAWRRETREQREVAQGVTLHGGWWVHSETRDLSMGGHSPILLHRAAPDSAEGRGWAPCGQCVFSSHSLSVLFVQCSGFCLGRLPLRAWYMSLPLTRHWPARGHVTTAGCREARKCILLLFIFF